MNQTIQQAQLKEDNLSGKYLTFFIAEEEYGIEIKKVKEIIGIMNITSLPRTSDYIKGVINLRGKVIPVVDLRLRFGMEETVYTKNTCIIVVETLEKGSNIQIGIIVDGVSEVTNISSDSIEPTSKLGRLIKFDFILGMAKSNGKVKTLLKIDNVLTMDDLNSILENN